LFPSDLTDVGGELLFQSCQASPSASPDCSLWESDGTSTGTRRLADLHASPQIQLPFPAPERRFTQVGPLVYFAASTPATGLELWAVPRSSLGLCGNGAVDPGETCDAGQETATCNADCTQPAACGDYTVNHAVGETCDEGHETVTCDADCTAPACGDGTVNGAVGEPCDDGNTADGDCCTPTCTLMDCADGDGFTIDSCVPTSGCIHTPRFCVGDCDRDGHVVIGELVTMVNVALNSGDVRTCLAGDPTFDGSITVDEMITAVGKALTGCGAA
jgi:cysteine-rich repeat protein